jgi:hypothetical protein
MKNWQAKALVTYLAVKPEQDNRLGRILFNIGFILGSIPAILWLFPSTFAHLTWTAAVATWSPWFVFLLPILAGMTVVFLFYAILYQKALE